MGTRTQNSRASRIYWEGRFDSLISPEPNTGCWLWLGTLSDNGYGIYAHRRAHRIAFEQMKGGIPPGLDLDHLCRVRCCVNPEHLEPVTRKENCRRSPLIGRSPGSRGNR